MNLEDIEHGREYMIDLLQNRTIIVYFTKKDGSLREMKCTLQPDLLPKREVKEDKENATEPKPVNEEVIHAFDLEKDAWRSFRVDSVTGFDFSIKD